MATKSEQQDSSIDYMINRARELREQGLDFITAGGIAAIEQRIKTWPSGWGDDFQILVYGDFDPPESEISIPDLGIIVHPEKLKNTIISSATTVVRATVKIEEKSILEITKAVRRINVFLGAWTLVEWAHGAIGWWSYITHGSKGGAIGKLHNKDLYKAVEGIINVPDEIRKKVDAALYWVREPRSLILNSYKNDLLRVYASYWNAFECLVDAINIANPRVELTKTEKQERINEIILSNSGEVTRHIISKCYNEVVNTSIRDKASHALTVCCGTTVAEVYLNECFKLKDENNRLYIIRNHINHGDIDAENPEEIIRVEARLAKLWMIVWRMFSYFIPFPAPVDPDLSD